jgi:hypothetical protein
VNRTLLLLLLAAPACLSSPDAPSFAPPVVTGGSPEGVDLLAVASVSTEGLPEALAAAGFGLRIAGERGGLHLRSVAAPPDGRERLAAACGILPFQFSAPVHFRPGDELSVSALAPDLPVRGFTLNLRATGGSAGIESFHLAAIARPPDGSLLPVLRGDVPVSGRGPILVTGDLDGRLVFAALLLLETAGENAGQAPPEHVLGVQAFFVPTGKLDPLLPGGAPAPDGIFEARRLAAASAAPLPAALAGAGQAFPPEEHRFVPGAPISPTVAGVAMRIREEFRLADWSYQARIEILNREGAPVVEVAHGEWDTVLLVGRDAHAPGTSVVVLLRARPIPADGRR